MDVKYCFKTQIVDECNLNCRGCDHFAPLAKTWHQPLRQYIDMIKTLKKQVGNHVREILLYGGEPTLHENLYEIIFATKVVFPKDVTISITTNGILLDKFFQKHPQILKDKNIECQITEYTATKGIVDKLKNKYPMAQIFHATPTPKEMKDNQHCWKENMFNINLRNQELSDMNEVQQVYDTCYSKSCEQDTVCMRNGILSPCPMVMCADIFDDYFKLNYQRQNDYVAINDDLTVEDLDRLAHNPCEYCKRCGNIVYGFDYSQSKKDIREWQLEEEND